MAGPLPGSAVASHLNVTDRGQVGAGATTGEHIAAAGLYGPERSPDAPETILHQNLMELVSRPAFRLTGGFHNPYLYRDQPERDNAGPGLWSGYAPTGANVEPNVPELHGPAVTTRRRWFSWWPFRRPQNDRSATVPAVGAFAPGDLERGVYSPSAAALGESNQFAVVDPRRQWSHLGKGAGYPMPPPLQDPSPWTHHFSARDRDDVAGALPTPETRAGRAEPWMGRPATVPRDSFSRPFDKWAAEHFSEHRSLMAAPHAARPIMTREESIIPGAGYRVVTPAPGMEPLGTLPNTWRVQPEPWDQSVIDAGANLPAGGITRSWRLG